MSARQKHLRIDDYLDHIEQAAGLACSYVNGMDKQEFLKDKRTQQAVIYNIMIIGEAASQIINEHPDFVELTPEVPWREMRGIRNRMAHGYFELNMDIVWNTVSTHLKDLRCRISDIRGSAPTSENNEDLELARQALAKPGERKSLKQLREDLQ